MRTAHDFAERCIFEIGKTRAVFALRQEQVPETLGLRQRLQFFDDWKHHPWSQLFRLAIEALLVRIDVLVHEVFEPSL
jgi:hypothetical protein